MSSASGNILDILKESSVAQDILLAKNKVSEEGRLDEPPHDDTGSIPEPPMIEQQTESPSGSIPSDLVTESQDELLARVLESFHEFSPEVPEENLLAEPGEKPQEEIQEPIPKISKSTFENIPVYGVVPEKLLETHLCLDQEHPPEIYDSFVPVPDSLLNRFEVDSPPLAGQFVQTQDAALAIRKKEGRG